MANYYRVQVEKLGNRYFYPEVGHKNYGNMGYNPEMTECIWASPDDVDLLADAQENNDGDKLTELTETEAKDLLATWGSSAS